MRNSLSTRTPLPPLPMGEVTSSLRTGDRTQATSRCTACGANRPIAVKASPVTARRPDDPGQRDHAGDDGGRRQHDADLERRRGDLVMMVFRQRADRGRVRPAWRARPVAPNLRRFPAPSGSAPRSSSSSRSASPAPPWRHRRPSRRGSSLAWSDVASTTVRRMLLAWKNAHRFEASTFLLMDSVCAPLPSVSDSARNSAITAISNAIFLLEPEACSACSACSMLSCAPMILPLVECIHD